MVLVLLFWCSDTARAATYFYPNLKLPFSEVCVDIKLQWISLLVLNVVESKYFMDLIKTSNYHFFSCNKKFFITVGNPKPSLFLHPLIPIARSLLFMTMIAITFYNSNLLYFRPSRQYERQLYTLLSI